MDPIAGLLSPEDRRRSRTMGLLAAGFSMMSGDSSDTLTNIGTGGLMGIQAYMGANERALEAQQLRQAQMAQIAQQQARARQEESLNTIIGNIQSGWKQYFRTPEEAQLWSARADAAASPEERVALLEELQQSQQPGEVFEGKEGEFWQVNADGKFARLNDVPPDMYVPNENESAVRMRLGIPLNAHPDDLPGPVRQQLGAGMEQYRRSGATQVNIEGDRERSARENALGGQWDRFVTEAESAEQALQRYGVMETLLNSPDMETGTLEEYALPIKRAASGVLGVDFAEVPVQEAFNALARQGTLQASTVLKGSISERELDIIAESLPSLGKTMEGNRMILRVLMEMERRKMERLRQADEFWRENGTLDGFNSYFSNWARENPLLSEEMQANLLLGAGG